VPAAGHRSVAAPARPGFLDLAQVGAKGTILDVGAGDLEVTLTHQFFLNEVLQVFDGA
jgi:hypothetical protein